MANAMTVHHIGAYRHGDAHATWSDVEYLDAEGLRHGIARVQRIHRSNRALLRITGSSRVQGAVQGQRPVKCGVRLPAKAATPSA